MWYQYLDDFRHCISVFAIFSHSIAVLDTPQCPPPYNFLICIATPSLANTTWPCPS